MSDSFGTRLKLSRVKAKLTQAELARLSGVSRKQISDFEMDIQKNPRHATVLKLAIVLGVKVEYLIKGDIESSKDEHIFELKLSDELDSKLKHIAKLNGKSTEEMAKTLLMEALYDEAKLISLQPKSSISPEILERIERLEKWVKEVEENNK